MEHMAEIELVSEDLPVVFSWGGISLSLSHRTEGSSLCGDIEKIQQGIKNPLEEDVPCESPNANKVLFITAQKMENPSEVKPSNQ